MENNPPANNQNTSTTAGNQPMPETTQTTQATAATSAWPGAFGIYKFSKDAVRLNGNLIGILIVISVLTQIPSNFKLGNPGVSILLSIVTYGISLIVSTIFTIVLLSGVKKQKLTLSQAFNSAMGFLLSFFLVSLMVGFISVVSILLFIIPFFFIAPRLVFAPYLVIDKNMSAAEAIQMSWSMSKGKLGKIYGIIGANLAMGALAITIIGIPFAIYFIIMYSAAIAILYVFIQNNPATAAQQPAMSPASQTPQVPASPSAEPSTPVPTDTPQPPQA